VAGCYQPAGRPKLEDALMREARLFYLHHLVYNLDQMVTFLKGRQDELFEQNRRLKKVDIRYSDGHDGVVWFYVGEQHLTLQQVKDYTEIVPPAPEKLSAPSADIRIDADAFGVICDAVSRAVEAQSEATAKLKEIASALVSAIAMLKGLV